MLSSNYIYNAKITKIVDGDTVDAEIDVGFSLKIKHRLRLLRVNTAETNSKDAEEKKLALAAKDYTSSKILGKEVIVVTYKSDAFGRYLADVFYVDDGEQICLNDELLESGLAKKFKS